MDEVGLQLFQESLERNGGSVDKALSESIQAISLLALSRTDFFSKAAFYGGTALRVLFGLDRFSEALDFSLMQADDNFRLTRYFQALQDELESFGFVVEISKSQKRVETPIESAFIKTDTRIHTIKVGAPPSVSNRIHRNAVCKVKLEIDTDPPARALYEMMYIDEPAPFSIRSYSGPALLAGKLDAVLSRAWKNRVKGRDWYDFAYLVRKKVPVLLPHLQARLEQKRYYCQNTKLEATVLTELIEQRIDEVDFEKAKADVLPFINRPQDLDVWSKDYFRHVLRNLSFVEG